MTTSTTNPSPKPSLYEIAVEHREIYDILVQTDGELTPELEERLDTVLRQGKEKLDAAAAVYRRLTNETKICEEEAHRMVERGASFARDAQRLRERMQLVIEQMYGGKFKTAFTTAWTQSTPPTVSFSLAPDADMNTMDEKIIRTTKDLNRLELQRMHKTGEAIPREIVIEDKPGTTYLRIK